MIAALSVHAQVVWNAKMREEVLTQMEAARQDPAHAGAAPGFRFQALQASAPVHTHAEAAILDTSAPALQHC